MNRKHPAAVLLLPAISGLVCSKTLSWIQFLKFLAFVALLLTVLQLQALRPLRIRWLGRAHGSIAMGGNGISTGHVCCHISIFPHFHISTSAERPNRSTSVHVVPLRVQASGSSAG
ncbi:hypothetical protein BZA05DRAFT_266407 [Tricharina praecox]|uniref:uncharacterized protein n=1 Tax=Tricharina praecox TaxID=43433 RepID=UPI00221F782C|nr:uncharacterized protein BZA05DRAFT_266407 [Tricharina praecox]KAI5854462.1 hypothetical protein BZA05DRAFT_266407 [Tricharina praecox]